MDSSSEDGVNQYRVSYPQGMNPKEVKCDQIDFNKNRFPVSRPGNVPGRVKRVVSCKRKTHHLLVVRKKQPTSGRMTDVTNKENEMSNVKHVQMSDTDPWGFTWTSNSNLKSGRRVCDQPEHRTLTELTRDHSAMIDVLCGRHLRLRVAFTLWQRDVGELLTYFLRIQDIGAFVDFLPLISRSISDGSSRFTIGCCVDLFPLVERVLSRPFEEYILVGLTWINSVLKNWWDDLKASGCSGSTHPRLDENLQVFNQQLSDFWHQEPLWESLPGAAGDMAKGIDAYLSQLSRQ